MSNRHKISIIIVSFNVRDLLLQCLTSIERTKGDLNVEVIVVDNNSSDDSVAAVRREFPQTIIKENNYNAGFSAANNQGMSLASGKFFFLLNPDTELHEDALSLLFTKLNSSDNSVVAPQLLNSDGSIQYSCWKAPTFLSIFLETMYLHRFINLRIYKEDQYKTDFFPEAISGAALFFKSTLFIRIGGLDEQFFWSEDTDFCIRANQIAPLAYISNSKVTHHSGKSSVDRYHIVLPNQVLSKVKLIRKHRPRFIYCAVLIVTLVFILSRMVVFGLLSPISRIYRKKATAYSIALKKWFQLLIQGEFSLV